LEFFILFAILNLALWPVSSREALIHAGAVEILTPIMAAEGDSDSLQGLISTMVCAFLDVKWTAFPQGGIPAAKSVAELMTNIVEKKGKDGQYDYGFFKLSTATKAYRDLARLAAKADNDDNNDEKSYSNTNVLAFPSAVALILQIISDMVISSMDAVDAKKGSGSINKKYSTPDDDMKSAEYAAEALEAMLPAILQVANDKSSVQISKTAASEISQMLLTFANVASTKTASIQAATKIKQETSSGSSSSSRPILEMSHNLWTHYRKCEGQPLHLFT
jgi:hypothetical protein